MYQVKGKSPKMMFLGFWLMKRASNWTKSPLYLGKKGFFGGFYPFPSESENDTKFEKNW